MTSARRPQDALRQEMRRGALVLAALLALRRERCGSDLIEVLAVAGVSIEPGALYPMLRRLEDQGLLTSEWRVEDARRRRFYISSPAGQAVAAELKDELISLVSGLQSLTEDTHDPH
jgi:PadR family transcriptional regulator PadR